MSERMKEIFLLLIWAWEKVTIFFRLRNTFKISFHNVYDSVCSMIFCMKNARRYPGIPLYVIYLYVTRNMEIFTFEACKYMYTVYVTLTKSSCSDILLNWHLSNSLHLFYLALIFCLGEKYRERRDPVIKHNF